MAEDKKKPTPTKKKKINPEKFVELNPTLEESKTQTAVVTFGRFNPPTQGHQKLADKIAETARSKNAVPMIFASHSQDKKKNPLPYDVKIGYLQKAFGRVVQKSKARTIIEVAKELSGKFSSLVVIVGSDRVKEFETLLRKYNNKEYNFDSIEVISAGERDPDADDVSGMSASKLRALVAEDDYQTFRKGLPTKLQSSAQKIYDDLRQYMGLDEEFVSEETLDERAPLTIQQRRARGRTMRRLKTRMKTARKIASRKKASTEKLKIRARKKARNLIRDRLAGGKKYSDMSPSEKVQLDKRLHRIPDAAINRIATRQLPQVRRAEMERLARVRGGDSKNESLDSVFENFLFERRECPPKRPHMAMTKEGKVKFDRRFKFFRKEAQTELDESKLNDLVWAKNVIKPGATRTITKKYNPGDKVKYAGGISTVIKHDDKGFVTLSNPNWSKNRVVPHTAIKTINEEAKVQTELDESFIEEATELMNIVEVFISEQTAMERTKEQIRREKESTKARHDRMKDAARRTEQNQRNESADPADREQGTDSLVKIYKKDTPGQKQESYFTGDIPNSFGDFRKGSRVSFSSHSMDMADDDTEKEGTVVGSTVQYLRVRDDDGILYRVRHNDATLIESVFVYTLDEMFEFEFLSENMLDKAISAIHKHVIRGKSLENVIWEFSAATGFRIPTKELINHYKKVYGDSAKNPSKIPDKEREALIRKYSGGSSPLLRFNEFTEDMKLPQKTLGVSRSVMPQVRAKHMDKFIKHLKDNDVKVKQTVLDPRKLKAIQGEFDQEKIKANMETLKAGPLKPIIVSADDFVIDGNHRWLAAMNAGTSIAAYKANVSGNKLLKITNKFKKVKRNALGEAFKIICEDI
jgi:nicotinic acid mononucleotide adenylyltransferase